MPKWRQKSAKKWLKDYEMSEYLLWKV
jgi:hypothetical protein